VKKLLSAPLKSMAEIFINPSMLEKFGTEVDLQFHGPEDAITVSPSWSAAFPWVGLIMPLRNVDPQNAAGVLNLMFPDEGVPA
jgi:hypothetical protein